MSTTLLEALSAAAFAPNRGHTYVGEGGAETVAYARVADEALELARRLAGRGVAPGDTVGLAISDPRTFVRSFFGLMLTGAIPVPIAPRMGMGTTGKVPLASEAILLASRATAVICDQPSSQAFQSLRGVGALRSVWVPEELAGGPVGSVSSVSPRPEDTAFLQFTSGSTSSPKGVRVTHACLLANSRAIGEHGVDFQAESDVTLSWLPLHHDMGLIGFVVAPLVAKVHGVFMPTSTFMRRPGTWFRNIQEFRATITFAPNFAFALATRSLARRQSNEWDLSSVRVLGCGAEPIDPDVLEQFSVAFGAHGLRSTAILPCYGMAEATLAITFGRRGARYRVDEVDGEELSRSGTAIPAERNAGTRTRRIVSCGRPLPDHEIRIVGADGKTLPERREGTIIVRGPSVSPGYFGDPPGAESTFREGWLNTGDLGYVAEGELFVCGRSKDLVICRAVKFHPTDIERVVAGVPGLQSAAVAAFSIPGRDTERLVVVAECPRVTDAELRSAIDGRLKKELDVVAFDVVLAPRGTLTRTTSGKIQRARVRDWYMQRTEHRLSEGAD